MIDFSSKVITYFKADTTDIKAKMRDLSDEERKVQQEHLKSLESRNKTYDDWIGSLGKANQALELVGRAVGFAADSYSEYTRMLELRSAAGAASIEGLQRASLGLRTEQELLEFAAKAQNSTFKLSQEQMETAQKAMIALTRAGFDQEEVTNKVTDALVKANGGGLDDFGIKVKDASSDVERFNNLMAALADKASGVDQASMTSAEAMKASGVSMKESFDRIKQSIGELVASLAPLIQSVSAVVALGAKTLSWVVGVPGSVAGAFTTPNRSKLDTLRGPKNDQDLAEYYANLAANNQAFDRPEGVFTDQAFVDKFNAALERKRKGKVYSKSPFADPNYNPFAGNMPSFSYQDRDFWDAGTSEGKLDEATIYSSFDRMKKALKEAQDK